MITTFLLPFMLAFSSWNNEPANTYTTATFEEYVSSQMDNQHIPALSVTLFKDNELLYEQCFGYSQVKQKEFLKSDHLFLMASVSKVVTATALLQLYEQNLFALDDEINDYLPFEVSNPHHKHTPITFRMLLTHTSGIADAPSLNYQCYYGKDSPVLLRDFLKNYLSEGGNLYNAKYNFHKSQPGSEFEYSNVGTALIGLLIEEISGSDFNTYCIGSIFTPLEMEHSYWRLDEIFQYNHTIVRPYEYVDGNYESIQHYTFTDYPNGGLRSTGKDMYKLISAIAQRGKANNARLLQEATVNTMITPQIPSIDPSVGLHLFHMDPSFNLWGHKGKERGVSTLVAFNPETGVGAVLLANSEDVDLEGILLEAYQLGLNL